MEKDYHAKLIIHGLPEMKAATKKQLIKWLEAKVKEFKSEKDYKIFARNYRARLMK